MMLPQVTVPVVILKQKFMLGGQKCHNKPEGQRVLRTLYVTTKNLKEASKQARSQAGQASDTVTLEGEDAQPGLSPIGCPFEVDGVYDYLRMGDGFCFDDSEAGNHHGSSIGQPMVDNTETVKYSDNVSGSPQVQSSIRGNLSRLPGASPSMGLESIAHSVDDSLCTISRSDSRKEKVEASTIGGLNPIPTLRRKRKKT